MHPSDRPVSVFVLAPLLVRWGLQRLLQSSGVQLSVDGSSAALPEAAREAEECFPDVVIVDAEHYALHQAEAMLQGGCGRIVALLSATKSAGTLPPASARIVCVNTRTKPAAFVRAVLDIACQGGLPAEPSGAGRGMGAPSPARLHAANPTRLASCQVEALTPKQREIVRAISMHASSPAKVIAAKLHISEHTLRNHLSEIYSRMGVKRRTHLQAVMAGQLDAFPLDPGLLTA